MIHAFAGAGETPGARASFQAPACQLPEVDGNRPAGSTPTFATSTGSFEARPYRPSCAVKGCPEIGGWIVGLRGFRKLDDERSIGLFCAEHMTERIAALDPMRHGGAA